MDSQKMVFSVLLVTVMAFLSVEKTNGLIHVVGGGVGWTIPPNPNFYQDWAKTRVFGVGDELVFPFNGGSQTVQQVHKLNYDQCSVDDSPFVSYYSGPVRMKLDKVGDYYFLNHMGLYCENGQKLFIKVVNAPGSSGKLFGRKVLALPAADQAKPAATTAKAPTTTAVPASAPVTDAAVTATAPVAGPNAVSGPESASTTDASSATTDGASTASGGDKAAEDNKASGAVRMTIGMTAFVSSALACIVMM